MKFDLKNPNDGKDFNSSDIVRITKTEDETLEFELTKLYSLVDELSEQYPSSSLVNEGSLYYYQGNNVSNYVWYNGIMWRVIEFDTVSKTITLISDENLSILNTSSWDILSDYENSNINNWLSDYFYETINSEDIITNTYNIGSFDDEDSITIDSFVGLLSIGLYNRAGGATSYLNNSTPYYLANYKY